MDTRETVGWSQAADGTPVAVAKTTYDTPPIAGIEQTEFYAVETPKSSIGFLSLEDAARYLTSATAEPYDSYDFQGQKSQELRTGLGLRPEKISFKPHAVPAVGLYGEAAEAAQEAARTFAPNGDALPDAPLPEPEAVPPAAASEQVPTVAPAGDNARNGGI